MSKMYDLGAVAADRFEAPRIGRPPLWRLASFPFAWLVREVQARRDANLLASLDERGLADVGLSRGSVDFAVRHGRPLSGPDRAPPRHDTPTGAQPASLPASAWTEWR